MQQDEHTTRASKPAAPKPRPFSEDAERGLLGSLLLAGEYIAAELGTAHQYARTLEDPRRSMEEGRRWRQEGKPEYLRTKKAGETPQEWVLRTGWR